MFTDGNAAFRTGDLGRLENDGWLFLTGRAKEVINRGGELLSPAEIEAVLLDHPLVHDVMVFSTPHDVLGEVVAVALPGASAALDLRELRRWARERLAAAQLPQVLVRAPELPRTHGTRKLRRIGYAEFVGVPMVGGSAVRTYVFNPERDAGPLRLVAEAVTRVPEPPTDPGKGLSALVDFLDSVKTQMYRLMRLEQDRSADALRIKRSASGTAKFTMHMRYLAHSLGFGPDDLACHFLPLFWRSEWPEDWERAYTSTLTLCFRQYGRLPTEESSVWSEIFRAELRTGVQGGSLGIGYLHCRTCYFDSVVSAHAEMSQLVILGAGFDTRCYRLRHRPSRCFEVDAPTTQAEKREALRDSCIDSSHVTFVAVDFANEDWIASLLGAGFDPSLPTLFLWEGVTYYLPDDVVRITMRHVAACTCARIAFDVYYSWFSLHPQVVPQTSHSVLSTRQAVHLRSVRPPILGAVWATGSVPYDQGLR